MQKFVQTPGTRLYSGMAAADTTCRITPYPTDLNGNKLAFSDFGDSPTITVDPKVFGFEEICMFSAITDNNDNTATLTLSARNLISVSPYVTAGTGKLHGSTATVVFSDNPQVYARLASKENNEQIPGTWTFLVPPSVPDPVGNTDAANKEWVLAQVLGGPVSFDQEIVAGTAGENLTKSQLVYLKNDGKWWRASSATAATCDLVQIGIVQATVASGASAGVLVSGLEKTGTYSSAGSAYYANDTLGAIGTSAGTVSVEIGVATSTGRLEFQPKFSTQLTALQKAALAGNGGTPSGSNAFVTQQGLATAVAQYDSDTDQVQAVQNSTYAAGEANATTKHSLVAQKFVAAKTAIRGVRLYKAADTGSFTGTVKVALQADSAGSPSGSDLATLTITNAAWLKLNAAAEFGFKFSAEYASLVSGSSYWIVVTTSSNDNSNHINLGVNTAGGYASGALKFQNGTDGWQLTATSMLYFKTLEGVVSRAVGTGTDGAVLPAPKAYAFITDTVTTQTVTNSTVSTTVATTVFSQQLEGGQIGANQGLKVRLIGKQTTRYGNNNNDNAGFLIKYNGVTVSSYTSRGNSASQDGFNILDLTHTIMNQGAMNSQAAQYMGTGIVTGSPSDAGPFITGSSTSAADFSQPGLLEIVGQASASSSSGTVSETAVFYAALIERIS